MSKRPPAEDCSTCFYWIGGEGDVNLAQSIQAHSVLRGGLISQSNSNHLCGFDMDVQAYKRMAQLTEKTLISAVPVS